MAPARGRRSRFGRTIARTIGIALCCALLFAGVCCPISTRAQTTTGAAASAAAAAAAATPADGDPGQTIGGGEAPVTPPPTTPTPTTPDPNAGSNGGGTGNGNGNAAPATSSSSTTPKGGFVGSIPLWALIVICAAGGLLVVFFVLKVLNPRATHFDVIIFFLAIGDFVSDLWFIYTLRLNEESSDPPPSSSIIFKLAIVFTSVPFVLNFISLMWLIWGEMKNLAFRRWLNHHFAPFTAVVLTSCTNVDAMFILDSHACGLEALMAPWSEHMITLLRMFGLVTILFEDIPQACLQIFVISTSHYALVNVIALCFSATTIIFGVTKRVLVCCVYQFDRGQEAVDVEWGEKAIVNKPNATVVKQGEHTTIVQHPTPLDYSNGKNHAIAAGVGAGTVIAAHQQQQPTPQNKVITASQNSKNAFAGGAPAAGVEGLSTAHVLETAPPSVATTPQSRFRSLHDRSTQPGAAGEGGGGDGMEGLNAGGLGALTVAGVASTTAAAHHTSPTTSSSGSHSRLDQLHHPAPSPSPSNLQLQQQSAAPAAGFSSHAAVAVAGGAHSFGGAQPAAGTPRLGLRTSRSRDDLVAPTPLQQQLHPPQQLDLNSPRERPAIPPRPPSTHNSPLAATRRLSGGGQPSSHYYSPQLPQRSLVQSSAASASPPIPSRPLQLQTQSHVADAPDASLSGIPIVASAGRPPAFTVSSNAFVPDTKFATHAEFEKSGKQEPAPHETTLADLMKAH